LDHSAAIQDLIIKIETLSKRLQALEGIEAEVILLRQENVQLREENAQLREENAKLRHENAELKAQNSALLQEIADLKARLTTNSNNSHKPPSSDGYAKKPAFPRPKGGKRGGQFGHKGNTLQQVATPDEIVVCAPGTCTCGRDFTPDDLTLTEKRQVFELPEPRLVTIEYQLHKATCPDCGQVHVVDAPDGVNAPALYGKNAKALGVFLNVHHKIPLQRVQQMFSDLFGHAINESTLYSANQKCYDLLEPSEQIIKSKISQSKVNHADETGHRVDGRLMWLHAVVNQLFTYLFVDEKRGKLAIQGPKSALNEFIGWLIHDCWGSYFDLKDVKHALCGAHILRELTWLIDNQQSQWAKELKSFLLKVKAMPFEDRIKRRKWILTKYDKILTQALESEPSPHKEPDKRGRKKRTKGRNLAERLEKLKEAVLAFAFNPEVPFTNNLAERDVRHVKIKQKVSTSFRTMKGAEIYARISGFISTARKQNRNVFHELCDTFDGHNFLTREEGC
jgi:transposase